jgi:GT2 family glycosyltransferase
MATVIREVDLASSFDTLINSPAHDRCMLLFRWRRRIVGRAFLHLDHSGLNRLEVAKALDTVARDLETVRIDELAGYDERESVSHVRPSATIAICTRERPAELRRALDAVARQTLTPRDWVVVDNAPQSDATRCLVQQFPGVRYVCEPLPGLDIARNRALREAAGEIVAFSDDDAAPEPEWLDELLRNFADPRVACATGLTLPAELETPAQEMFEDISSFARGFRRRTFDGLHDNPLAVGQVGAGANMAVRKSAVFEAGGFDERLDGGTSTFSGGDHDMFVRLLAAGHRIVYEPRAVSWHRHRRTLEELERTIYGYGVGVYAMWTGLLLERREIGVARLAWSWFRAAHWPEISRMLRRRPPSIASAARRAELRGCCHGPAAWFAARRVRAAGAPR